MFILQKYQFMGRWMEKWTEVIWLYSNIVTYNVSKSVGNSSQVFTKFSNFIVSVSF